MTISRVGVEHSSEEYIPVEKPRSKPKNGALDAVRERAFQEQQRPARSQRASRRNIVSLKEPTDTTNLLKELKTHIGSKQRDYKAAFKVSGDLFERYNAGELDNQEKSRLIATFKIIAIRPRKEIGDQFFGFLKACIAYHLAATEDHDPEEVTNLYKEAAEAGNADGMYHLAKIYESEDRVQEAFDLLLTCANAFPNLPASPKEVAVYYQEGWNDVPPNPKEAENYYKIAIAAGCLESSCNLACLLEGRSVQRDEERQGVITLYEDAIRKNDAAHEEAVKKGSRDAAFLDKLKKVSSDAAFNIGVIYQNGWHRTSETGEKLYDKTLINLDRAEFYFRKAKTLFESTENSHAIAETILLNKDALTQERWEELQAIVAKHSGSFEFLELEQKIAEIGIPQFQSQPVESTKKLKLLNALADEAEWDLGSFAELCAEKAPLEIPNAPQTEVERLQKALMSDPTNIDLLQELAIAQLM